MSDIETRVAPEARPVILTIRGRQNFDDLEPDGTELVTGGLMTVTPEGYVLSYEESELTGMKGTVTTFEIKDGRVYLTRSGTVNSRMVFKEGKQHTSLYETPFGELSVDIRTSRLRQTLTERGGLLEVRYSIAVEHTVTGQNSFLVRVREKN